MITNSDSFIARMPTYVSECSLVYAVLIRYYLSEQERLNTRLSCDETRGAKSQKRRSLSDPQAR